MTGTELTEHTEPSRVDLYHLFRYDHGKAESADLARRVGIALGWEEPPAKWGPVMEAFVAYKAAYAADLEAKGQAGAYTPDFEDFTYAVLDADHRATKLILATERQ